MKAWIHSLIAAAIAAFSTSVTAAIADPASFNFTVTGLEHIAAVGGLSAALAVLALLKQSPLPAPTINTSSTIPVKSVVVALVCAGIACSIMTGCSDWERTTYQSLAASKATIDQAALDYNSGTIAQTAAAQTLITQAQKAQTAAVDAMVAYENVKKTAQAGNAQADVIAAVAAVVPLIAEIKALYAAPKPASFLNSQHNRAMCLAGGVL